MPTDKGAARPAFLSSQVTEARYFFADLQPRPRAELLVVCGGFEQCREDYRVVRDHFEWYSIEFVLKGRGSARIGEHAVDLLPGSVFCYRPGVRHEIVADPHDPPGKYFIDFTGRQAPALLRRAGLEPVPHRRVLDGLGFSQLMESLLRYGQNPSLHREAICVRLLEAAALALSEPPGGGPQDATGARETFQRCQHLIETRALELHSLADIAGACQLDAAYLCRLFARFGKTSPYRYLLARKMNHAAALLARSGGLVKEVAREVGYDDPFHFSRTFKRTLGISPTSLSLRRRPVG
jgi:AraC-like DNA-binding protein